MTSDQLSQFGTNLPLLGYIAWILYFIFFDVWTSRRQSIGKLLTALQIEADQNEKLVLSVFCRYAVLGGYFFVEPMADWISNSIQNKLLSTLIFGFQFSYFVAFNLQFIWIFLSRNKATYIDALSKSRIVEYQTGPVSSVINSKLSKQLLRAFAIFTLTITSVFYLFSVDTSEDQSHDLKNTGDLTLDGRFGDPSISFEKIKVEKSSKERTGWEYNIKIFGYHWKNVPDSVSIKSMTIRYEVDNYQVEKSEIIESFAKRIEAPARNLASKAGAKVISIEFRSGVDLGIIGDRRTSKVSSNL